MRVTRASGLLLILSALLLLGFMAGPASAENYDICTGETTLIMPDGTSVPAWGFALDQGGAGCPGVTVPGPELTVSPGQPLTINLRNTLRDPVSLQIVGQATDDAGNPVIPDGKVMSFTKETPPDGTTVVTYSWSNLGVGTHLLQDGTDPAKHVQMGLFMPVVKDAGPGEAYPGIAYDSQKILVFHDVDPEMQAAIQSGNYGFKGAAFPSSITRQPSYHLINGAAYPDIPNPVHTAAIGERVMLRFLNAGYEAYVPQMLGAYMSTVAEDGIPLNYAQEGYSLELPAGKTIDALFIPEADGPVNGKFPLFDGRLNLSNKGSYQGTPAAGGMLAYLQVGTAQTVTAAADAYAVDANTPLNVPAPGVLANDTGGALTAALNSSPSNGTVVLNSDGSFTYTPNNGFSGIDSFSYRASLNGASATATVTITVNAVVVPPVANADAYAVDTGTTLTVPTPGVLGNDTGSGPLTASLTGNAANGTVTLNSDGSFTYTPNTNYVGTDSFTYQANMGALSSSATVTITVNAVNRPPTAVNDTVTMNQGTSLTGNVLANDSDPDGNPLTITNLTQPASGAVVINANNTLTYTPPPTFSGTVTFTYTANDGALDSNVATVTVIVNPTGGNLPPIAVDDNVTVRVNASVVNITPLANDYDPEGGPLYGASLTQPAHGVVSYSGGGVIRYRPNRNFTGTDVFTYRLRDAQGNLSLRKTSPDSTVTLNEPTQVIIQVTP